MTKGFSSLFLLMVTLSCCAQEDNALPYLPKIPLWDTPPQFTGGSDSLIMYFQRNTLFKLPPDYPEKVAYVLTEFLVSKNGTISEARVINGIPGKPHLAAEAVRLLENSPKWIPAKMNNKRVHATMQFSVPFYRNNK